MARPKSNGSYAPLSATYFRDDSILEAGPDAELLFVRVLAFLSDASSDGFITDRQIRFAVGYGLRNVQKRITRLQEVGLLESVDGGFTPRSWHKWNKSAEEIGKNLKRDRDRKAALSRNKEASPRQDDDTTKRQGSNKDAEAAISDVPFGPDEPSEYPDYDQNSEWNPSGTGADSAPQSTTKQVTTKQSNVVAANRADVSSLCNLLADLIERNGSLRPTITKGWVDSARLLIDKDGRDANKARALIEWVQADSFWKANVMSMVTFRAKYDQLRLAAIADTQKRKPKPTRTEENLAFVDTLPDYAPNSLEITR